MRKDCSSCAFVPEFEFFSPTKYEAHGYCPAFDTEPEIIEHEDTGDDGDYYYTCDGQVITDCPCWELAEEADQHPYVDEDCDCGVYAKQCHQECSPSCSGCTDTPSRDEILANLIKTGLSTMSPTERLTELFKFLKVETKPGCHTPPLSVRFF